MNPISVNRKIFNSLNESLQRTYVSGILVDNNYTEVLNKDEIEYIITGIVHIINNNEEFNEKYGVKQKNGLLQVDETCNVPAEEVPSGSYYSTGDLIIYPFDWSWDEKGDFDYSFFIARIM